MRSLAAAVVTLVAGAGPALAATPIDGTWYFECNPDIPDAENTTVIGDDKIVSGTLVCDIMNINRIGGEGQVWRLSNSCVEQDERWIEDVIFGLEVDIDGKVLHLVEVGMNEGYVVTYLTCK
ncbi:MAG: hypothetical protein KDJ88_11065 [Bauldia sp.]|nr:hypothetical protein [Bauldia sp.]